jgi:hypothetical protein
MLSFEASSLNQGGDKAIHVGLLSSIACNLIVVVGDQCLVLYFKLAVEIDMHVSIVSNIVEHHSLSIQIAALLTWLLVLSALVKIVKVLISFMLVSFEGLI